MLPNRFIGSGYSSVCFKLEVDEKRQKRGRIDREVESEMMSLREEGGGTGKKQWNTKVKKTNQG